MAKISLNGFVIGLVEIFSTEEITRLQREGFTVVLL